MKKATTGKKATRAASLASCLAAKPAIAPLEPAIAAREPSAAVNPGRLKDSTRAASRKATATPRKPHHMEARAMGTYMRWA